jgi:hypothetical protein
VSRGEGTALTVVDPSPPGGLLEKLDGTEASFLEIFIAPDGTLQIYEAYSQGEAQRVVQMLRELGVKAEVTSSSPCG